MTALVAPVRLQLSRKKGFDLQALSIATNGLPAVNVARPSKWGNPFTRANTIGCHCNTCLAAHYQLALSDTGKKTIRAAFKGKNVACWCPPNRDCHGDVILEIAAMTDEEFERILLARNHIVDANKMAGAAGASAQPRFCALNEAES